MSLVPAYLGASTRCAAATVIYAFDNREPTVEQRIIEGTVGLLRVLEGAFVRSGYARGWRGSRMEREDV